MVTRVLLHGVLVLGLAGACLLQTSAAAQTSKLSTSDVVRFLETAAIVEAEPIGQGVTRPWRLTLRDGALTHDAAFQSVDERAAVKRLGSSRELNFVDSYRYNIAAYRLASLVGLGNMMPITVERSWNGRRGALSWWVDDVMFTERTRQEQRRWPRDMRRWNDQMYRMLVFAELVHDTDRNQGNLVYTRDWTLYMLDFSRAFRVWDELQQPDELVRCDRGLFGRLQTLTGEAIEAATLPYLTSDEITGVLQRRDRLVTHFQMRIDELGEDRVLY